MFFACTCIGHEQSINVSQIDDEPVEGVLIKLGHDEEQLFYDDYSNNQG